MLMIIYINHPDTSGDEPSRVLHVHVWKQITQLLGRVSERELDELNCVQPNKLQRFMVLLL